jgi:hypothetical protein
MAAEPVGKRLVLVRFDEDVYELLREFCVLHGITMTGFIQAQITFAAHGWEGAGKPMTGEQDEPDETEFKQPLRLIVEEARRIDTERRSRRPRDGTQTNGL